MSTIFMIFLFAIVPHQTTVLGQANIVDYTINWATVPTTSPPALDTQVPSFGSCMCAIAVGCEYNCHCDPKCNADEINIMFNGYDKEVAGTDNVVQCIAQNSANTIVYTTQQYGTPPIQEYADTTPVAFDAICIKYTNLPSNFPNYYTLPTNPSVVPPTFPVWPNPTAGTSISPGFFGVGSKLPYLVLNPETLTLSIQNTGYFYDPRPFRYGGLCSNDTLDVFMENHNPQLCAHEGSLEYICSTALNSEAGKFFALTNPLGYADGLMPMRHIVVDTSGNILEDIDPSSLFSEALGTGSGGAFSNSNSGAAYFNDSNPAGPVCQNAILQRQVTITYTTSSGGGTLYNASITYVVGPVEQNAAGLYWVSYSTTYIRSDLPDIPEVPLAVSNPGYVKGDRVLAGRYATNNGKAAVIPRIAGLTIPSGRLCSDHRMIGVLFSHNVQDAGCFVEMNISTLQGYCATGITTLLQDVMTPAGVGTTWVVDRLGFVANASYASINDWVNISGATDFSASGGSYNSVMQSCSLVVGLRWVIGITRAGLTYNPQDVIISAQVEPIYGTWAFRGTGPTSLFRVAFEVFFVRVPDVVNIKPIIPPAIITVNQDVFFPFRHPSPQLQDTSPNN